MLLLPPESFRFEEVAMKRGAGTLLLLAWLFTRASGFAWGDEVEYAEQLQRVAEIIEKQAVEEEKAEGHQALSIDALLRQCALVAHVRVAGKFGVPSLDRASAYFLEILDPACGPAKGQLVILIDEGHRRRPAFSCRDSEEFILFARREPDGTYRPCDGCPAKWTLSEQGKPGEHPLARSLFPVAAPETAEQIIAQLWSECRQLDFRVRVSVNARDVAQYEPHAPLRVQIAIDNTGGRPLRINNDIEYECQTLGVEKMAEARKADESLLHVRLYLQPLGARDYQADELHRLHERSPLTLTPGERCEAEHDLAEEYEVMAGGEFAIWAEVGGRRSPPVAFELPRPAEAIALEKALEEWIEGDGPFRKVRTAQASGTMPSVQATLEADAIAAALQHWLTGDVDQRADERKPAEIVLLSAANLPETFSPELPGFHVVTSDLEVRRIAEPAKCTTTQGEADFKGRMLQVESVGIDGPEATVEIREGAHDRGGSGATYKLIRENGKWQIHVVPQKWIS
jgi:hypothetical protein